MTSAHYGRMRAGRCVELKFDNDGNPDPIGCSEDIIRYPCHLYMPWDYCNWETFKANCTRGQVILMTTARYGRMRHGRCVPEFYDKKGNQARVGCFEDILR